MNYKIDAQSWKSGMKEFREKTAMFYSGELSKNEYKGFSGRYGSYAQKDGKSSMLRLRMTAGVVTKEKLAFIAASIRKYNVNKVHFTTCETIQLHNLHQEELCNIMENALDVGIVTMGGGGDFPRNVMCSPLSGIDKDEYFDVMPYAKEAAEYLMNFIDAEKMPRKLKVCFSNSPSNVPHATYRDLGFVATSEGKFDVYSAGGLGNNPKFGVKVAEGIEPDMILYYIKAMWLTFCAYGDYENRAKARTRYIQEKLGGAEEYKKAYLEKLEQVFASREELKISISTPVLSKTSDGSTVSDRRVIEQKQSGLYTVIWHPIGGMPSVESLCSLSDTIADMDAVEIRLSGDETAYIVNLTGAEAKKVLEVTKETANTLFETSVSCIGSSICQVGVRDSQALLNACVKAVREANVADGALPQIHISGCPSSCGTHQTGKIGFRGGMKKVDGVVCEAFVLYVNGCHLQGQERMGREVGTILTEKIPEFLVRLGKMVETTGLDFNAWFDKNEDEFDMLANKYTA